MNAPADVRQLEDARGEQHIGPLGLDLGTSRKRSPGVGVALAAPATLHAGLLAYVYGAPGDPLPARRLGS
ncbi:MAG: hypothetical protein M3M95_07600 [Pseudomonadota bacterium]|nr:hypothetical protein [Pseudomonadota bacterium]